MFKNKNNIFISIFVSIALIKILNIKSHSLDFFNLSYFKEQMLKKETTIKKPKYIIEKESNPTKKYDSKIVGGITANLNDFLFIVSLQTKMIDNRTFQHYCGGSIISDEWILTAAHCVENGYLKKGRIVAGIYNLKDENKSEKFLAQKIIIHPKRNQETRDYDFALIKLDKKTSYPHINLDDMPHITQRNGIIYTVAGWGATQEGGEISDILMKADVPFVDKDTCQKAYKKHESESEFDETFDITDSMICAGYREGGKDACRADSGGPLIYRDKNSKKSFLVGVVSWGVGCARPNLYGVYGKVSEVIEWIKETINKN